MAKVFLHCYEYQKIDGWVHVTVSCGHVDTYVPLTDIKLGDYPLREAGDLTFRSYEWDAWRQLIAQTGFKNKSLLFFKELFQDGDIEEIHKQVSDPDEHEKGGLGPK